MYLKPTLTAVGCATQLVAGPIMWCDDAEVFWFCPFPWEAGIDE